MADNMVWEKHSFPKSAFFEGFAIARIVIARFIKGSSSYAGV